MAKVLGTNNLSPNIKPLNKKLNNFTKIKMLYFFSFLKQVKLRHL